MRNTIAWIACVLATGALAAAAQAEDEFEDLPNEPDEIVITISPSTMNLESNGTWVTVHADIRYSDVAAAIVTLDGIAVKTIFADNRGDLVAKFCVDDVKGIVAPHRRR